ncbi:MAG TPA: redoxin domain-containing protein, partial [Aggregatilineales bacterium]|nr:redoxin domain-containing protein [Aggregatilineales bacterium]
DSFPTVETNNAMVLGISPDPIEDLKKWKNKMGFQYPLLSDIDHAVMEAWGAWGEKTSYGRTTIGVIRSHWVIDEDGNIIDEQIKITPEDSVRKALEVVGG